MAGKSGGGFKPRYGTHVFGEEYWPGARPDRDELVARLIDRTSVAIFGLRRIGKSSLIAETRERLRAKGRKVLWVDLQKLDSLAGTLDAILAELAGGNTGMIDRLMGWANSTDAVPPAIKARLKSIIGRKLSKTLDDGNVDDYAEALFEQIGLAFGEIKADDKPVIIFDELPLLIMNTLDEAKESDRSKAVARLNKFLAILRHWRSVDVGVAMVICGSFSMAWLRRDHGIADEHFNDCEPLQIEEMDRSEARKLLDACVAVSKPKKWTDESAEALLGILPAFYPGVIQLAHNTLRYAQDASPKALAGKLRDNIEDALEAKYYVQFDRRFSRYSVSERERAARLFKAIAEAKDEIITFEAALGILTANQQASDDQDGRDLLDLLQSDGFVNASRRRGVRFSSGLAKAWRQDT